MTVRELIERLTRLPLSAQIESIERVCRTNEAPEITLMLQAWVPDEVPAGSEQTGGVHGHIERQHHSLGTFSGGWA